MLMFMHEGGATYLLSIRSVLILMLMFIYEGAVTHSEASDSHRPAEPRRDWRRRDRKWKNSRVSDSSPRLDSHTSENRQVYAGRYSVFTL